MRAQGEHDGDQTTDSSRLHIPFTGGHANNNSIKSDKRGSNASDTTSYIHGASLAFQLGREHQEFNYARLIDLN